MNINIVRLWYLILLNNYTKKYYNYTLLTFIIFFILKKLKNVHKKYF